MFPLQKGQTLIESGNPAAIIEHCSKVYPRSFSRSPVRALDGVDLQIKRGKITALLGPNGAGKTTLIKLLSGLIIPSSGQVWVNGLDLARKRRQALMQVGAVLEGSRNVYWELTPEENLYYFANLRGLRSRDVKGRIFELLDAFDLHEKRCQPVGQLSRGMQQKVALAVALIAESPLLLLDEPTLGLDLFSSVAVKNKIVQLRKERGTSILLTTHQLSVADEVSDEVALIYNGRLVEHAELSDLKVRHRIGAYKVVLRDNFDSNQLERLRHFGSVEYKRDNGFSILQIGLKDPSAVRDLLSQCNIWRTELISVSQEQPNLEAIVGEIFQRESRAGLQQQGEV